MMFRCACLVGRLARKRIAIPVVFLLYLAHPWLHPFEGGALDAVMNSMTGWAWLSPED